MTRLTPSPDPIVAPGGDGPGWRPPALVDFVYRAAGPLVDRLANRRIAPNYVTATALVLAGATGVALGAGYTAVGAAGLIGTGACDLLDGHLARRLGAESAAGAFFDSFADRIAESFILGGLAYAGGGGWLTWLAIWALAASLAISYARARGEGLGVEAKTGVMQRPERMTLLIVVVGIAALAPLWSSAPPPEAARQVETLGVGVLAVLATATAIRRALSTFLKLQAEETASPPADPSSPSRSERRDRSER